MFTGLVRDVGEITGFERQGDNIRITISSNLPQNTYQLGSSILCSGICLTVVEFGEGRFVMEVSPETVEKTNISSWNVGTKINLEPSLCMGDELGGHLVFGHVDALATITELNEDGDSWRFTFEVPENLKSYFASKGSVSLDGISLTVNEVNDNRFGVCIIPHTWTHTTLSERKVGDKVNLEVDMLARYVARMLEGRAA
ncbi:MAG: riboflavin synthase [Micavibrio sp.]|nr:riboflavin synthase [Micavibrio sp.]|tara:strand:+ start:358 stop:954 length:597 start_codon:yes stop_codon:yes gene_type:complete